MRLLYTGDGTRYYPTLGLTPAPGTVYDLAADPGDGRWQPEPEPVKKTASKAEKKEVGSDATA